VRARAFDLSLYVAATAVVAFFLLPVVAIFTRVPPRELVDQLSNDVVRDALRVTLVTNLVALAFILVLGVSVSFTRTAVMLAVAFVAGPFYVRPAIAAFESVDPTLLGAARTLGAGPGRTFIRVALPLASAGLGAGAALAFARGLGEFGATIMFAGSLQGVTQTLSLAIYQEFDLNFDAALAISALLVLVSGVLLLSVKVISGWRSTYASLIPFGRSPSTSS